MDDIKQQSTQRASVLTARLCNDIEMETLKSAIELAVKEHRYVETKYARIDEYMCWVVTISNERALGETIFVQPTFLSTTEGIEL